MNQNLQKIDHSALRVSQVVIILLNVLAFVLGSYWLTGLVAFAMLLGVAFGIPAFGWVYRYALKPAGLAKPDVLLDHPEPHRFAQAIGGVVMMTGTLALALGGAAAGVLGWALVWLVAALAALNAFAGFCVGCMFYYWLARLGLPGFTHTPPAGGVPGMRPNIRP